MGDHPSAANTERMINTDVIPTPLCIFTAAPVDPPEGPAAEAESVEFAEAETGSPALSVAG